MKYCLFAFLLVCQSAHASIHDWKFDAPADSTVLRISESANTDETASWKAVGHRWAAAYDRNGKLAALYDLSFAELDQRISLGVIGTQKAGFSRILGSIMDAQKKSGSIHPLLGETVRLLKEETQAQLVNDEMPENWWKAVPWKNQIRGESAPTEFTLADIDYDSILDQPESFWKEIRQAENAAEGGEPILGKNFLKQISFVKRAEGGYVVYWTPSKRALHPRKMADFRRVKEGLERALTVLATEKALSVAIDQIPIPPVAALLNTAVDRFFYYRTQSIRTRQEMILEMLNSDSPSFSGFTEEEKRKIAAYQYYRFSTFKSSLRWVFTDPESVWENEKQDELETAAESLQWLKKNGIRTQVLNPRFAMDEGRSIYLLSRYSPGKTEGPYVGLDSIRPNAIRARRMDMELLSTAVRYSLYFVPFGGFLLAWAYDWLVSNPEEMHRRWEWRLIAELEERSLAGENWDKELDALYAQTVNPFETGREASERLIQKRKIALGI